MSLRVWRSARPIAALAAAAAVAFAGHGTARADLAPTLYVSYAMNCTFEITNDAGRLVTSIAPGAYQVEITTPGVFGVVDLSGIFDFTACKGYVQFQLTGPGVAIQTTLDDGDGDYAVFGATFRPSSTYVAQDNNQPSVARATISTLASGSPTVPQSTTSTVSSGNATSSTDVVGSAKSKAKAVSTALLGTLDGFLTSTGKPTLVYKGTHVSTLKAGRYKITVTDKAATSGFTVQGLRKVPVSVSGSSFVGTHSVTVDLTPGQWLFYASATAKKNYFIVVA